MISERHTDSTGGWFGRLMHRLGRVAFYAIIILVALAGVLIGIVQTPIFRKWLRDYAVGRGNEFLQGELQIGRIDGNLFTSLEIEDALLTSNGDTVLVLPSVSLRYSFTKLFKRTIQVHKVAIDSPVLAPKQLPDSTWNISAILKSAGKKKRASESGAPFGFRIVLDRLILTGGAIEITAYSPAIPKRIDDLSVLLSGSYAGKDAALHLQGLSFSTIDPAITLRTLAFELGKRGDTITLTNLVLATAKNTVRIEGLYDLSGEEQSRFIMRSEPIELSEFEPFLPAAVLHLHPTLTLDAEYEAGQLEADLEAREGDQEVSLLIRASNIEELLAGSSERPLTYRVRGTLHRIDLEHVLREVPVSGLINGDFKINGSGMRAEETTLDATIDLEDCILLDNNISRLQLRVGYEQQAAHTDLTARGNFGEVSLTADLRDILESQEFDVTAALRHIDLSELGSNDSLDTDINADLSARGSGLSPELMQGSLELHVHPTKFLGIAIDTLLAGMRKAGSEYRIDTLFIGSRAIELGLAGRLDTARTTRIRYHAVIGDLTPLAPLAGADTLHAAGSITGTISGRLDSLTATAALSLGAVRHNAVTIDTLTGECAIVRGGEHIGGTAHMSAIRTKFDKFLIDTVRIESEFENRNAGITLDMNRGDSLELHLESGIAADSTITIDIPAIAVRYKNQRWSGGGDDMRVTIGGGTIHIDDFQLETAPAPDGKRQYLRIDGSVSPTGDENVKLAVSGFDTGSLSEFVRLPVDVAGILDMDIAVTGTAVEPLVTGSFEVTGGRVNRFPYEEFSGKLDYGDRRLHFELALLIEGGNSLEINGQVPIDLSLSDRSDSLFSLNDTIDVRIKTAGIPLTILMAGDRLVENTQGKIVCDIGISHKLGAPRIDGFLRVSGGAFNAQRLGTEYNDIRLKVLFDGTRVQLEECRIAHEGGFLQAKGQVKFTRSIIGGELERTKLDISARNFSIARNRNIELVLSGDIALREDTEGPRFSGRLEIIQSSIYLPAFADTDVLSSGGRDDVVPILVAATQPEIEKAIRRNIKQRIEEIEHREDEYDPVKQLTGKITIIIPGQCWLRSPQLKLSLIGDLDLVKSDDAFELFGTIELDRGDFSLFGRHFQVKSGKISFEGEEEINPEIFVQSDYQFRTTAREKKSLEVRITGKLDNLLIEFLLEGRKITEADAVSLILFGKLPDELHYGQKTGTAGSGDEAVASDLATDLLSSQLSQAFGETLGIDYVEVKSYDNWQSASFYVGKYVTSDLFISYQRAFGDSQYEDIGRGTFTMEYELSRLLYLQLIQGDSKATGIDFIFKIRR